jgi:hypothetical protein
MDRNREALDALAIMRLQGRYGDTVTRQAWDELVPLFLPGCPLRVDRGDGSIVEQVGPAAIGRFIADAIAHFEFFAFTIVNTMVDVGADGVTASARLYIHELRQERDTHRWTDAYGLYRDTYRKDDGCWRFATRDYSSIARTSATRDCMDVFPIPGVIEPQETVETAGGVGTPGSAVTTARTEGRKP